MVDAVAKAARRTQINMELIPLRRNRDDNVITRNRLNIRVDDLRSTRDRLRTRLSNDSSLARAYERHDGNIRRGNYHGTRRDQYGRRVVRMAENIRTQRTRHQSNLEQLLNRITLLRTQRDILNTTINTQNNRIATLESRLHSL